ncbi:MAG: hypothetical protein IKE69_01525 [Thermoguttaceae bacterium]|nr:hypothetical protein [Thermoguttaceae bacterium]
MTDTLNQDTFSVISLLADVSVLATAMAQKYADKSPIDPEVFHAKIVKIRKALLMADRLNRREWADKHPESAPNEALGPGETPRGVIANPGSGAEKHPEEEAAE